MGLDLSLVSVSSLGDTMSPWRSGVHCGARKLSGRVRISREKIKVETGLENGLFNLDCVMWL